MSDEIPEHLKKYELPEYRIQQWTILVTTTDDKDHYIAEMPNWLAKEIDKFLFGTIEPILQKNGDVDMWDMEEE